MGWIGWIGQTHSWEEGSGSLMMFENESLLLVEREIVQGLLNVYSIEYMSHYLRVIHDSTAS